MKKVEIYTDGACRSNPGPGGWGAILCYNGREKELSGGEEETTNNRMELLGVISALSALKEPCEVDLYSDSKYIVDAINLGWTKAWVASSFRGGKIKNPDLWQRLLSLTDIHSVNFIWVKGHNGHPYNERCDALATAEADKYKKKGFEET